ncbi:ABC transporter substrate-binding protein [Curtobacterium sp. ISL-83]|uniref:ABC transporter substrate-binding protein n=1 Tax=Curtobacterium sp. ISL-83 TaxID=2819145 RepID=UPI001BE85B99|nr:extracellular solute-binding protein [Curtobacterium sp. ISL-83]MBT2502398.1 extracellular solute-binding protein [Curtobacterium sp. ISL-83]
MKSPSRALALAAATIAGVGLLAGCSSTGTAADTNGKTTITVASLIPGSTKAAFTAFDDRVKAFEKANPKITVKTEEYQWTGATFASQLAGGTLPDVFNVPFTDSKTLLQNGQLADLTTELKQQDYTSKFNPKVLDVAKDSSGHLYGVPYGPYGMGISYNRAIFTKAGLDPDKPPTTWDEVRADAKTISEKVPGTAGYMQMTSGNTGGWELTTTTYARGGRVEVPKGGKTVVKTANPETKAALQYLHDLRWKDHSMGSNFIYDWSGINQAFAAGQVAMYPSGSDVLTSLVQQNGFDPKDYGLATIPLTDSANAGVLSGGNVAAVSPKADAAQKAAAVKWISFYYVSKLTNQKDALADATVLADSKQPVGVPSLPVFDKKTYDEQQSWIKSKVNIPLRNVAPFTDKIFDQDIVPEPAKATQDLYGALDSVVQSVLTDENADIDTLLTDVDTKIQAKVDAAK